MAKTDLQGAFAYVQSLPPGYFQDNLIRSAFSLVAEGGDGALVDDKLQGALAMIQSLHEGPTKDMASKGGTIDPLGRGSGGFPEPLPGYIFQSLGAQVGVTDS